MLFITKSNWVICTRWPFEKFDLNFEFKILAKIVPIFFRFLDLSCEICIANKKFYKLWFINFITYGPYNITWSILHSPYRGTISGTSYIFEAIEGQVQSSHRGHSISNHLTKLNLAKIIVESFSKMICCTSVI